MFSISSPFLDFAPRDIRGFVALTPGAGGVKIEYHLSNIPPGDHQVAVKQYGFVIRYHALGLSPSHPTAAQRRRLPQSAVQQR
jgi:hypothetical protein